MDPSTISKLYFDIFPEYEPRDNFAIGDVERTMFYYIKETAHKYNIYSLSPARVLRHFDIPPTPYLIQTASQLLLFYYAEPQTKSPPRALARYIEKWARTRDIRALSATHAARKVGAEPTLETLRHAAKLIAAHWPN